MPLRRHISSIGCGTCRPAWHHGVHQLGAAVDGGPADHIVAAVWRREAGITGTSGVGFYDEADLLRLQPRGASALKTRVGDGADVARPDRTSSSQVL